ncbi:phage-related protein [Solibacillus kalamii]|uniref:Phage tail tape measure protein n=1 Tax=Solibacillus kalamii TaxID=1748298 RepID=A0ABX3ZIA9_9BACL|nr:hypothetical protein [Solibacillus kalamii]MBM7663568.1 phage-related protein [Solibacillus kalamii]OUZ39170.1 hypothetical protein CBM15_09935 [Solibacillus kalamii]
MAIDLKAVFRVQDNGTSKLRKIMQQTDKLSRSTQQVTRASDNYRSAQSRLGSVMDRTTNANKRFSTSLSGVRVGASGASASLSGMQSALLGVVGAYLSFHGAKSAFDATIGSAAQYEQSSTIISAMMNDADKYQKYLKMIDDIAIDSPLLNSSDMTAGSKGLLTMTNDLSQLQKAWNTIEKLNAVNPLQGVEGAVYSLKALQSGDVESIVDRFDLNRADVNPLKGMSFADQIKGLDKLLAKMNITEKVVRDMGNTTLGQWNSLNERVSTVLRDIGEAPNSRLGDYLKKLNDRISKMKVNALADKLGGVLDSITEKAIDVVKWLWKWREPVAYIVGGVTAAASAFMIIGALSLLANPLALITAGIAGAAVGFKALYDNSESFRGVIDGIKTKAMELWSAFKTGGAGGLLNSLFGDGMAEKVAGIVDKVKTKFGELQGGFSIVKTALANGWTVISDIFSKAWTLIQPILSGLLSMLKVVGDYASIAFNNIIAPAINFVIQLFSTLWALAKPILTMIGGLFEVLGAVVTVVWKNILAPLMEFVTTAFSNAFNNLSGVLEIAAGWFDTLGRWANTAKGYLSDFASVIAGIKLPDWVTSGISTVVTTVGNAIGAGTAKSHYHGLDNVPYDGYNARLHKGERVLTAQENKEYSGKGGINAGGITVNVSGVTINSDSDIDKIAHQLALRLETEMFGLGI